MYCSSRGAFCIAFNLITSVQYQLVEHRMPIMTPEERCECF
ncbi:hypothetical protein SLEP1_g2039 [Rubroshorea leprosula]|uniref:Uncharacterized protein n=1 Tax=Rubroshorea leprosula TaxID=152421 RepID=A0AAV5HPK1_9ROSI|nr:hypothetical protein SLEP1_g2039 [Rubroshorea leprosula]